MSMQTIEMLKYALSNLVGIIAIHCFITYLNTSYFLPIFQSQNYTFISLSIDNIFKDISILLLKLDNNIVERRYQYEYFYYFVYAYYYEFH